MKNVLSSFKDRAGILMLNKEKQAMVKLKSVKCDQNKYVWPFYRTD